jgi:Xaa-Pro aminopeptidase
MFAQRLDRTRAAMDGLGVDVLLLSVGPDLPWLCGYEAMPLERLTMLVVPREGDATLVVPKLEAPRVLERADVFHLRPWGESEDPVALVAELVGAAGTAAIGDHTWSRFLLDLQRHLGDTSFRRANEVIGDLRAVKDTSEIDQLRRAAQAADRVAVALQAGDIPLVGRTEAEVSADIGRRLVEEGHARVNFAIVAAGANAASPHHDAGERIIYQDEVVLCDFGGTMIGPDGVGYCSDITRCVHTGEPSTEFREIYGVLHAAQAAACEAATVGTSCQEVDATARRIIIEAGYGGHFVHRTGHGIGIEAHEDPYIVAGNEEPLQAGHAFSIEPGIYRTGEWGMRLEDIVVATDDGPERLNTVEHGLVVVT